MRARLLTLVAGAAILTVAAPAPSAAHSLSPAQIRAGAERAAAALKRQTGATSTSAGRCRRHGPHQATCAIGLRYRSGASRCAVNVAMRLVGRRVRWAPGTTTCY